MNLRAKILGLEAGGKHVVIINKDDADDLGIKGLARVSLKQGNKKLTAIANIATKVVPRGTIGIYEEVKKWMGLTDNSDVQVDVAKFPSSLQYIRDKLKGRKLIYEEILEIVKDTVEGNLSENEIASFVTALHNFGVDLDEATSLTLAMVETGDKLELNRHPVVDKHCLPKNVPTIVRNDGNVKIENIGTIIDGIFDKCEPKEIVYNNDGSEYTEKNVENLYILSHDDNGKVDFRPVSGVFRVKSPKYLKELILIGNRSIKTTLNHSIFVLKKGKIINIPIKDIKKGDFVVVPTGLKQGKSLKEISIESGLSEEIRNCRKFEKKIKITPEFMRLLGYYVSKGFTNYQGVFFNFESHEKKLIKDCIECVKKVFGITPTINKPHKTTVRVCVYSQILSKVFEKNIKGGSTRLEKRIPPFIFDVGRKEKFEFLKALFKGDGYVRRGYEAIYVTSSRKLATDLQYLLSILGLSVSLSVKKASEREFPIKGETQKSRKSESYYIYTQAREIFGRRKKASIAYVNLLPIKELGKIDTKDIGLEFRRALKKQKYMTKEKLLTIIDNIKSEDVKKLINGDISVLQVKKTRKVLSKSKYIYDFKVDGYQRFIAGSAPICIHNSIGGVPGDKTTLLVVPIVAACGLTIPKTSSRAITSACGTADRVEALMPVDLSIDEMKTVVRKTNGCMVWGGSLDLVPADDIFVQVEYPLSIDPLMLPSIMGKKKAVGADYVVIDIPCGRGTKVKTIGDADLTAKDFIELGKRLGIKTRCAITYGEQPLGYTIGPALEAKEALETIMRKKSVPDLIDKAVHIAGILLEMVGKGNEQTALDVLKSGKAEEKLREIIFEQGGSPEIRPEDIEIGDYGFDVTAENAGYVLWISNSGLVDVARAAGSPKDKGAGIELHKKLGDKVKKGEKLFTVYAEKMRKLERVRNILEEQKVIGTGKRMEMLIHEVREMPVHRKTFILER